MLEVERKYAVSFDETQIKPDELEEIVHVEQSYLIATPLTECRIRLVHFAHPQSRYGESCTKLAFKIGNGYTRKEYEWSIPRWLYEILFDKLVTQKFIYKMRYRVAGWDIDVFQGRHTGIVLAECEVPTTDFPQPPAPACISFRQEVTDSGTFANKNLSKLTDEQCQTLVQTYFT